MLFYLFAFLPSNNDINSIVVYTGAGRGNLLRELVRGSASDNTRYPLPTPLDQLNGHGICW